METSSSVERYVDYAAKFIRLLVVITCIIVVVAYIFLMSSLCNSNRLNFVGKMVAVISNCGFILIALIVAAVQLEVKFLMKWFNFLHYWGARAGLQLFLGIQMLSNKEQLNISNLDSTAQDILASMAGWILIVSSVLFFIMVPLTHFCGLQVGPSKADIWGKEDRDKALLDEGRSSPKPAAAPSTAGGKAESSGGFWGRRKEAKKETAAAKADPEDPFADDAYASSAPAASSSAPAAQRQTSQPPKVTGYAPPKIGGADDDIAKRREQEDDELERLYAQANARSNFTAAD